MTARNHNLPLSHKTAHARLERYMLRTDRTFENAAHAAHWLVWTAMHWSKS